MSATGATVGDRCRLVRAKNAGPFRLTVDCFCNDEAGYRTLVDGLDAERVGRALGVAPGEVRRFALDTLLVVKFSLPRPTVQGAPDDRDLHGAQWALVVAALPL